VRLAFEGHVGRGTPADLSFGLVTLRARGQLGFACRRRTFGPISRHRRQRGARRFVDRPALRAGDLEAQSVVRPVLQNVENVLLHAPAQQAAVAVVFEEFVDRLEDRGRTFAADGQHGDELVVELVLRTGAPITLQLLAQARLGLTDVQDADVSHILGAEVLDLERAAGVHQAANVAVRVQDVDGLAVGEADQHLVLVIGAGHDAAVGDDLRGERLLERRTLRACEPSVHMHEQGIVGAHALPEQRKLVVLAGPADAGGPDDVGFVDRAGMLRINHDVTLADEQRRLRLHRGIDVEKETLLENAFQEAEAVGGRRGDAQLRRLQSLKGLGRVGSDEVDVAFGVFAGHGTVPFKNLKDAKAHTLSSTILSHNIHIVNNMVITKPARKGR